ncbi:MAG: CoB--CoM heterodisulfide reductase iron-sulfur subunit B family protein [Candidatus Zipacnadales bacterium]
MARLFYPGCSLEQSGKPYEISTLAVAKELDIDLPPLKDWNCCGATPYMGTNELWALALAARNLALTEEQGGDELVTVCNGCYVVLNKANKYMAADPDLAQRINATLAAAGLVYNGRIRVRHLLDIIANDIRPEDINARMKTSLVGLKVAPYYGCQIGRPFSDFDDPEYPTSLDAVLEALEAEVVPYPLKSRCCGGMLMSTSQDVAVRLTHQLLECADRMGAQCIAATCPLCIMNLEGYRKQVAYHYGKSYSHMPIYAFTQLLAVALGLPRAQTGVDMGLLPAEPALSAYL